MANKYTDGELIGHLRGWAAANGRAPYRNDIAFDKSMPSPKTYADRFGSWNKAAAAAGLTPHPAYVVGEKKKARGDWHTADSGTTANAGPARDANGMYADAIHGGAINSGAPTAAASSELTPTAPEATPCMAVYTRRVGEFGQIHLPDEFLARLGLRPYDIIEMRLGQNNAFSISLVRR
jgi:hypothetical protein